MHRLPLAPRRQDFGSEGEYLYAVEHWDEFYNEAEDLAMEKHYEEKHKDQEL